MTWDTACPTPSVSGNHHPWFPGRHSIFFRYLHHLSHEICGILRHVLRFLAAWQFSWFDVHARFGLPIFPKVLTAPELPPGKSKHHWMFSALPTARFDLSLLCGCFL